MRRICLLLCLIGFVGLTLWAEPAELTVWQLSPDSFPGDLSWVNGELYVSLNDPKGLALFEPTAGKLDVWIIDRAPGEFVRTDLRIFFALPYDGQFAWFRPDVGFFRFWDLPSSSAWPVFVLDGGDQPEDEDIWYLDWGTGRVGLFAPIESGPADLRDVFPMPIYVAPSTVQVPSDDVVATGALVRPADFAPSSYQLDPIVSEPFTEWPLLTPEDPAYGFTRTSDGRIWVSSGVGQPLHAIDPTSNLVTLYELPGAPFVTALSSAADEGIAYIGSESEIWFLAKPDELSVELGVLNFRDGSVRTWPVPAAFGGTSLRVLGDEVWFCDDELSSIYRFVPETSTFTWWTTGGDDAPRRLEPGAPGEMWISFDRSGGIARLVPSELADE